MHFREEMMNCTYTCLYIQYNTLRVKYRWMHSEHCIVIISTLGYNEIRTRTMGWVAGILSYESYNGFLEEAFPFLAFFLRWFVLLCAYIRRCALTPTVTIHLILNLISKEQHLLYFLLTCHVI